jgi:O-antigen biosynthesis protein WbqP
MKRAFDLVVALLLLIPGAIIIAILAVVIRITSPGPAIFRQRRLGKDEREFTCLKLRTMRSDTPNAPSHEVSTSMVTPIGGVLRRTKLDELPQLWNIVVGDMSFVGPRPGLPSQTALTEARRRHGLFRIRPGVTGVSQVAGVDMSDPEKLAALDATYLSDMSLGRDFSLLVATALGAGRGDRLDTRT